MALELQAGRLLVARTSLFDDNFHRTVILICRYEAESGALGVVLNRPTKVEVSTVLPGVATDRSEILWVGGPVDGRTLWMLHRRADAPTRGDEVADGVWFGGDSDLIEHILATNGPDRSGNVFRLFVGYAGWGPGQLESELESGAWCVVPAGPPALFEGEAQTLWGEMLLRSELPGGDEPRLISDCWKN